LKELRTYKQDRVRLEFNRKTGDAGTIDVTRGCVGCELKNAPCYAAKMARLTNLNFFSPVERELNPTYLKKQLNRYPLDWVRIGCISDPSLDWDKSMKVCGIVNSKGKMPVVISKLHKIPLFKTLDCLKETNSILQISISALATRRKITIRHNCLQIAKKQGVSVVSRINSAAFPEGSRLKKIQDELISWAAERDIPIIDTPIRLFKTSPIWKLVDKNKYHRHLSPMSGKLDSQRTAGLVIPNAYACFSTCSPTPTKEADPGCYHQCCTRIK